MELQWKDWANSRDIQYLRTYILTREVLLNTGFNEWRKTFISFNFYLRESDIAKAKQLTLASFHCCCLYLSGLFMKRRITWSKTVKDFFFSIHVVLSLSSCSLSQSIVGNTDRSIDHRCSVLLQMHCGTFWVHGCFSLWTFRHRYVVNNSWNSVDRGHSHSFNLIKNITF